MEQKKRRNISLPPAIDERLQREKNVSATVADALERYFKGKDGSKELTKIIYDYTEAVNEMAAQLLNQNHTLKQMQNWMNSQGANIH